MSALSNEVSERTTTAPESKEVKSYAAARRRRSIFVNVLRVAVIVATGRSVSALAAKAPGSSDVLPMAVRTPTSPHLILWITSPPFLLWRSIPCEPRTFLSVGVSAVEVGRDIEPGLFTAICGSECDPVRVKTPKRRLRRGIVFYRCRGFRAGLP